MNMLKIEEAVDLTTVANGAWVDLSASPFLEGWGAIAVLNLNGVTGTGSLKIQGTNDSGTTIDDLVTVTANGPDSLANVSGYAQVRVSVVTVFTAGTANAYLLG